MGRAAVVQEWTERRIDVQQVTRVEAEAALGIADEVVAELPGVARKTANVVLTNAFAVPSGVVVDTHVARGSQRLDLTDQDKPERIERDLMTLLPQDEWIFFGGAVVLHGRYVCTARAPRCPECILNKVCPKRGVS